VLLIFHLPICHVVPAFLNYVRGLFQSERANMLRMSEVSDVDHPALQHMLTDGASIEKGSASKAPCQPWRHAGRAADQ
jgi:hypothetical protein